MSCSSACANGSPGDAAGVAPPSTCRSGRHRPEQLPLAGGRCPLMSTIVTPAEAEAEIRAIMQARVAAVRAKDSAALVAHHAPDVVSYDLLEPLQYRGRDAARQ